MAEVPHKFLGGDCLSAEELNENFSFLCDMLQTLTDGGVSSTPFEGAIKFLNANGDQCVSFDFGTVQTSTNMAGCVAVAFPTDFPSTPNVVLTPCEYTGPVLPGQQVANPNELNAVTSLITPEGFEVCFTRGGGNTVVANEFLCFNWQAVAP